MDEIQKSNKNSDSTNQEQELVNPQSIKKFDVCQIDPESQLRIKSGFFAGCFMVVTDVKEWGVQGYVATPNGRGEMPSQAFVRLKFGEVHKIGKAEWTLD